jgi:hypothetical protein
MYEVPRGIPAKREAVYTVPKQTKGKELKRKKGGNEARGCNTQYIQIVLMRAATKKKSPGWGGIVCQVGTAALLMQSCCRQQIAAVENYFLFHFVPILILIC